MKKRNKILLFSVLFVIVLILIGFFGFRLVNKYDKYVKHKDFFKQKDVKIESWMTVGIVKNKFDLDDRELFEDFNIDDKFWYDRYTLDEVCNKFSLDCKEYVKELNTKVKENKK